MVVFLFHQTWFGRDKIHFTTFMSFTGLEYHRLGCADGVVIPAIVTILGILAALGFGAGGIGAGIFGAHLMPWWGGNVSAGGIVASFASTYAQKKLP